MKKWFDLRYAKYMSVLNKSPIPDMCDFFSMVTWTLASQEKRTSDPVEALFCQLRAMYGGNDALEARAVPCPINGLTENDIRNFSRNHLSVTLSTGILPVKHGSCSSSKNLTSFTAETSLPQPLHESFYDLKIFRYEIYAFSSLSEKSFCDINSYFNPH